MALTSFLIGSITGVAFASFFIGKAFYKFYKKSNIQEKKIQRLLKINAKIRETLTEQPRRLA